MTKQYLEDVNINTIKPKSKNWKMKATLKYIKYKRFNTNGYQRNLFTGIIQTQQKQTRINIWTKKCFKRNLQINKDYIFKKGILNQAGVINFGLSSKIQQHIQNQQNTKLQIYQICQLIKLGEKQKIIDFECLILKIDDPISWTNRENKSGMRQTILCGDMIQNISVNVTLWNSFLDKSEIGKFYSFSGFKHKLYENSVQLTQTIFSKIIPKNLNILRNQEQILQFQNNIKNYINLSFNYKTRTLIQIQQATQKLEKNKSLYSTSEIYFTRFVGEKCYYQACINCNSKIEDGEQKCVKCGQRIETCEDKYLLHLRIEDENNSIIVTLFDKMSQKLINKCNDEYSISMVKHMNNEEINKLLKGIRNKKFRVKMISSVYNVEDERYESHKIIQII